MKIIRIMFDGDAEFDVHCEYQPYEAPERGPEAQYPGCGESIEPYQVFDLEGNEVTKHVEAFDLWEKIQDMVECQFESDQEKEREY